MSHTTEVDTLRAEVERLCDVVRAVNARCDHLGMRLRDIKAERDTIIRLVHEVREANAAASDGQTFRLLTRRQELSWQALVDACCRAGGQDASAATTPPPDHADADILAAYSRNDGRREWVSVGTWLRPGEVVAHMDDPRPQQASGATTGYASGTAT